MGITPQLQAYEGYSTESLFPAFHSDRIDITHRYHLKKYLEDGGKVFVEFTKGARKGTIGELIVSADELLTTLYESRRSGIISRQRRLEWEIVAEGKPIKFKFEPFYSSKNKLPGILHFGELETKWVYTTKAPAPPEPAKVLYDHFGLQLEVGKLVLYPNGRAGDLSTRFGHITKITSAGTITIKPIKTRPNHRFEEVKVSPSVAAADLIILEDDLKSKVLMAKLKHG